MTLLSKVLLAILYVAAVLTLVILIVTSYHSANKLPPVSKPTTATVSQSPGSANPNLKGNTTTVNGQQITNAQVQKSAGQLANTGPGNVAWLAGATVVIGAYGFRRYKITINS